MIEGFEVTAQDIEQLNKDVDSLNKDVGKIIQYTNQLSEHTDGLIDEVAKIKETHASDLQELGEHVASIADELIENINGNEEAIHKLKEQTLEGFKQTASALETVENSHNGLVNEVVQLDRKVDNVKDGLTKVNQDVEKNTQALREQKVSIDAKAGKEFVNQELAKKADKATVDAELAKKVSKETFDNHYNTLVDSLSQKATQKDVDDLNNDVDKIIDHVNTLTDDVDNNIDEINKIKQVHNETVDHFESEVERLTGYIDENTSVLDEHSEDIAKLKTTATFANAAKVEENAKAIAQNKADLEKKADESAVREEFNGVHKVTQDLEVQAAEHSAKIAANSAAISTHTTEIANLKSAHQNVATLANRNAARIDQLDNRVNDLDKEVKNGLASQAALSGLFQPYNVGKVNVSAAVGGYKSKTALAVGSGYRFNENVAAKAGVAFSTNGGGATYNAGVNFEW
ncbi:YadA-like family protein [Aggregatibacter actinomycetemcomitans]|nr:YadA-like family protein [Aggregatibacter actinomycetemcomitans]